MVMNYWNEPLKIRNLSFPRFISGPLDGITDSPFRRVVREYSQHELMYTEMRHVAHIANERGVSKTLKFESLERPLNFQIAANKVDYIEAACEKILARNVDMVDLNVGCPSNNVIGSGSGSALMADIPRLTAIVKLLRATIRDIPFTVKIRAGFKCQNALEVAQLLQDLGVDALAIHPRLQTQKFEGRPDYDLVAQVKQKLSIPVIVSGGVVNWKTAKMVYEATGVDGFLIGRGIWAKPWKLKELREHAQGNEFSVSNREILSCALKQLEYMMEFYGEQGLYCFRKHLPFYIKGLPSASNLRSKLVVSNSVQEVKDGLIQFLGE